MKQNQETGSAMDQDQKKGATMERRKTMTMNWEGLDDDDDDRFFETFDRLSSAVPLDLVSSGSDDDEFDDSRMSFASTISSSAPEFKKMETGRATPGAMFGDYGMWMAEPGSINERRRRLLQDMGLTSNKNLLSLASTKFMPVASKKVSSNVVQPLTAPAVNPSPNSKEQKQEPEPLPEPSTTIMLVRSRSDGDIESFSTKTRRNRSSRPNGNVSDSQFGAFFLIKNLDTWRSSRSPWVTPLSKSFRNSKRRGVALLKNIKGVANSMSGLIADKERENPSSVPDQRTTKNSNSKWIKVRQHGKSIREFTALHLASAGEDKVIHVWEVQECEVMSGRPPDDYSSAGSTPVHPMAGNLSDRPLIGDDSPMPSERRKDRPPLAELSPMPSERRKKGKASAKKKGNLIPDYVHVPETVFSLSEKPVCSFIGHLDDVLDLSWSKSQVSFSPL